MNKQVFIVADIGLGANSAYHVGDEAMFLCNLQQYRKMDWRIVASSRSLSHASEDFIEVRDLYIKNIPAFLFRLGQCFLIKWVKINSFPQYFKATVQEVISSDLVHISGGGNLTSFWPGHIYYRCFIIVLASLYSIPIVMTGQTIGPFTKRLHSIVLGFFLNYVLFIGVRDNEYSSNQLKALGVHKPRVVVMPDDATLLEVLNNQELIVHSGINVGLSLHEGAENFDALREAITALSEMNPQIHFYLIPHYFDEKNSFDILSMQEVVASIDSERVHLIDFLTLFDKESINTIPQRVKAMTSQMDILIATRYHGIIFALSSGVPVVAVNYDEYYAAKNNGALGQYFGSHEAYSIEYKHIDSRVFLNAVNYVLSHQNELNLHLQHKSMAMRASTSKWYADIIHPYVQ
ncbi:MAG: polysaccharide pyruvyl transferase family protein [Patescibacteria group bacterium]